VTALYVVDDSEDDRNMIVRLLEASWASNEAPPVLPEVKQRDFIWDLLDGNELQKRDIVIADLYPTEYWELAPPPKPSREPSRPKDPTNFFNAAVDMVNRFYSKVPEHGAELIVMTFIPHYMERKIEVPIAGEKLRAFLKSQHLTLLEKERQHEDEDCARKAVEVANEVLSR